MSLLFNGKEYSCSNCAYATEYIPYFTFPHSNPQCSKGHGKCEVDKICGDYKIITATCGRCEFMELENNGRTMKCVEKNVQVEFNKKSCDDFKPRKNRVRE